MEAHRPNVSSGERKPRLMISKMELENFKSYAGVQAIGPFHKCFSSVVGPNGSGKSNVIDALLFVFGARAKQLRLSKVSELVHKSSLFPSLDYARVAIYFQLINDDESSDEDFEVVPGSEFCVARVAYANNTSKYTIDNRTSSFTEVGTLLRSHGIDLDNNRFLILQGEVEQIAMMKPKGANEHEEGLLEYLEDIIGSNQFVPQIEEASKVLDAVNEQRVEKVHRLKVAEKERDNLHGSKLEAEQFLDKEKQIRHKRNLLYQIYVYIHARNMAELSTKLEGANAKLAQERSKLTEGEDRLKATEKEYDLVKAEHSALQAELVKASSQHDSFERKEVKLQEDLKYTKGHWKKQQANVIKEEKKLVDVQRDMDALAQHIAKTEQVLTDFAQKREVAEEELSEHMKAVHQQALPIREQLEAKQQALALAEKAAGGLCTDRELILNQIALLHGRQEQVQQDLLGVESKLKQAAEEREQQHQRRQALVSQQQPALQQSLSQLEQQREQCLREQERVQQQLLALLSQLEQNKERLQRSKSAKNSNKTLQSIFQAARCGSLASSKIVGRLGDLAAIPAAYDVAMNTACKYLNYVVVQSTEDAQAVIAYLREHQLGRASFIVLDQMEDYAKKMLAPGPAIARGSSTKRLFDLLEDVHSEEVRAAFYMALGNTLVAEDLETAMAVAYQNPKAPQRAVTLAGQLIDVSGAMSGGGKETKKGDMRLVVEGKASSTSRTAGKAGKDVLGGEGVVTEEMIQRQEQQLAELQEQASGLQVQLQSIEQQGKQMQAQLKQVVHEVHKLDISLQHLDQQQEELAKRLETLRGHRGMTAEETREEQRLAKQVEQLDVQIAQASPNLKSLQEEVNTLQRGILAVGGLEASKLTSRIDSLSAQIDQLSTTLTAKRVEHSHLSKALQKGQASLEKSRAEMDKHAQRLQALETEQAEMTQDAHSIVDLIEEYKRRLTALEGALGEKQTAYHRLKEEVARGKAVEVDLVMEGERLTAELKEERGSQAHYLKELQTVRKQHVAEQKEWRDVVAKAVPDTENASMDVEEESWETLPELSDEDLAAAEVDQIKKEINVLEAERNKLKGNVNMNALLDYLRKDALYRSRLAELEAVTAQRASLLENLEALRSSRLTHFMQGFTSISLYLKEMYQMLTLGGDAELELIDSLDPFTEGIIFSVRPVKKSWKSILNLSGGEKTLASLALVFALHYYKPTPLYVMDEIDAALDFKNVSIVANYIKERTKNAQFIIISLRNNMFELADRLVGIYKTNDHTKSVTISPKLFTVPGMAMATPASSMAQPLEAEGAAAKGPSAAGGRRVPLSDTTNKVH